MMGLTEMGCKAWWGFGENLDRRIQSTDVICKHAEAGAVLLPVCSLSDATLRQEGEKQQNWENGNISRHRRELILMVVLRLAEGWGCFQHPGIGKYHVDWSHIVD